jgi:hypothetical protein
MAETVIGIRISADGSQLVNEVNASTGALDRLGKSAGGASSEAARLNRESVSLSSSFSGLKSIAENRDGQRIKLFTRDG